MATRRRLSNPQGQQPLTQVVAAPVDTFVKPGMVGAPQAPAPLAKPVQEDVKGEAIDLENLANAFGSLSSSLASYGRATAQRARAEAAERESLAKEEQQKVDRARILSDRASALRRQKTADADREAAKLDAEAAALGRDVAMRIDIQQFKDVQTAKSVLDGLLSKEEITISEHPAYAKALSVTLAKLLAKKDYAYDKVVWENLVRAPGDAYKNPQWFMKWYGERSTASIANLPAWVTDHGAFRSSYLAERSRVVTPLRAQHEQLLGIRQRDAETEALQTSVPAAIEEAMALAGLPGAGIGAPDPVTGEPISREAYAIAAETLTDVIDQHRITGTVLTKDAKKTVAEALINWIKNQDDEDSIMLGIRTFKGVKTGPLNDRKSLYSPRTIEKDLLDAAEPAIKTRLQQIRKAEDEAKFDANVSKMTDAISGMLEVRITTQGSALNALGFEFTQRIGEVLKGARSEDEAMAKEENAFDQLFRSLGGTYAKGTMTFKIPNVATKLTITIDSLVKKAKEDALTRQIVVQRAAIMNKSGAGAPQLLGPPEEGAVAPQLPYHQEDGSQFPGEMVDMFAAARSLKVLNFNDHEATKANVNALISHAGDGTQSRSTRLQAAVVIYKELAGLSKTNPNLPADVLGEANAELLEMLIEVRGAQDANSQLNNWDTVTELMIAGLNVKTISENLANMDLNGKSANDLIDTEIGISAYAEDFSSLEYYPHLGSGTAKVRAAKIARILVGSFGQTPANAVANAVKILKKNTFDVGGALVSSNSMTPAVATGADPRMRIEPLVRAPGPPTAQQAASPGFREREERTATIEAEHAQIKSFNKAQSRYDEHYEKMQQFRESGRFKDGKETREWKKWRTELFKLDNGVRKTKGLPPLVEGAGLEPNQVELFPSSEFSPTDSDTPLKSYWPRRATYSTPGSSEKEGSFTGQQMLELATEGYRRGGAHLGDTEGPVFEAHKKVTLEEGRELVGTSVFVPSGRRDGTFVLKMSTGGKRIPTKNPEGEGGSMIWSLEEVMAIARSAHAENSRKPGVVGSFDRVEPRQRLEGRTKGETEALRIFQQSAQERYDKPPTARQRQATGRTGSHDERQYKGWLDRQYIQGPGEVTLRRVLKRPPSTTKFTLSDTGGK